MSDAKKGGGGLPGLHFIHSLLHSGHEDAGWDATARPFLIAFVVLLFGFFLFAPEQSLRNFELVIFLSPVWLPLLLVPHAVSRFIESRQAENIAGYDYVLLELRLPREMEKTPLAMELVLSSLHLSSGESNWYKRFWLGRVRPSFSLELVSLGGQVHFYLWTRESLRRSIESFFYAQYPGLEIVEAEDYSRLFDTLSHNNDMFGTEYSHNKPDPLPIKTYVDFGLDKPGTKPEHQTDPLAQLLEFIGSIGPKEQFWIQFIIRMTRDPWKDEAKEMINEIRESTVKKGRYTDPATGKTVETEGFPNPTKGQIDQIAALERNVAKQGFDVGIRAIYTAPKDAYKGVMITHQLSLFKPFNSETYNSLGAQSLFSAKFGDYPWEDPHGHHAHDEKVRITEYYRRRAFFYSPYVGPKVILSTEELATLYHIPSSSVATPGLNRIQSKSGGVPANLPV